MNQPKSEPKKRSKRASSRKARSTAKKRVSRSKPKPTAQTGRKKRASKPASQAKVDNGAKATKTTQVLNLLSRAEGATIEEIMATTGWQAHSVRGFLSGTVKKRLQLLLQSTVTDRVRHYRVEGGGPSSSQAV